MDQLAPALPRRLFVPRRLCTPMGCGIYRIMDFRLRNTCQGYKAGGSFRGARVVGHGRCVPSWGGCRDRGPERTGAAEKGDRVEIVVDTGDGTRTYEVAATRAG